MKRKCKFFDKKRTGDFPRPFFKPLCLFSFKAVAASAMFRVAIASIAHVDFLQSTVIAAAIVLTFGYAATDCIVHFTSIFIHHNKKPPFKVNTVYAIFKKILTFAKFSCKIVS